MNSNNDPAIDMLQDMFNQYSREVLSDIYMFRCKGNFDRAVEYLLDLADPDPLRVKEQVILYNQLDNNFDFKKVAKWKKFDNKNKNHLRLLEGLDDPLTLDNFIETIEVDDSVEIVQLPCATERLKCNFFKINIVEALKNKPECPLCNTFYPVPGKQPTGSMSIRVNRRQDCQGYRGKGCISVQFSFPNGIQGINHPNPGINYYGTSRTAYLPLVKEGKKALKLLEKGFRRGELFTVGRSLTTGADNVVVWGSIHMKTGTSGGIAYHGWPDPRYFERLKAECAAKMIFLDEDEDEMMGRSKKSEATSNALI
uniref:RING-type E3 ubiquitin transferase n=1 Tax=Aplanochytrium stocchinoi TaxID=215587 RepID=A0A7S3LT12_9STRA|mmetsp:Transcript_31697/g.39077  ORF Transcript_31697/g.39077 Transcript_31697/m.39077 type:complete len:311 (+) Transcript_31697:254-1186(+)|eukprot:CAMPEP_0204828088 /NCGR_PEP_ID=MMETSP1346-20131115/5699_1 /ASSEMBLY_ACC=CAM_ASM_000771 /TAXON_ID=215587 /ORGANISM="Aplanochytrium stocchinoi, Strain GSBS06" /LENGTH=310 /DNA_ID=CAMNT_0051956889 /DNA_START=211 /DNA_END=1143 /DNA_ORIENTATION=+